MRTGVQGAGCDDDTDEGKCGWGVWTEVNSVSQKQAVLKKKSGKSSSRSCPAVRTIHVYSIDIRCQHLRVVSGELPRGNRVWILIKNDNISFISGLKFSDIPARRRCSTACGKTPDNLLYCQGRVVPGIVATL